MAKQERGTGDAFVPRKVLLALRAATQREHPDPTPVEIPESLLRPPSLEQRLQAFVRGELSRAAHEEGMETEEEANDLEVDDDDEGISEWSAYQLQVMAEEFYAAEPNQAENTDALKSTESDDRPDPVSTPSEEEKTQPAGSEGP